MPYDEIKEHIRTHLQELKKEVFTAEDFLVGECEHEPIGAVQSVANEMVADGELDFTPALELRRPTSAAR